MTASARRKWFRAGVAVVGAIVVGLLVFMLIELGVASRQLDGLRAQQSQQSKTVSDLATNLADAQSQLKQHGIVPTQPPPAQIIAQAGPPGAVGATGPEGREGPSGPSGASGAPGAAGLPGSPGPTGPAGPSGVAGASGAPGSPGPTGPEGPSGEPGSQGPSGPAGPSGPSGPTGPAGPSGGQGPSGPAGSPGPACPSGYQLTPEKINGNDAVVCEQPTSSPSSPAPSGTAPTAARRTTAHAAGASSKSPTWPVLLLSAVLVWPPEKRLILL